MSSQEMKDMAGCDSAVHVLAISIYAVFALLEADSSWKQVIGPEHRDEHARNPEVEALEANFFNFGPEPVEDLTG
jgi:hypothetical protein